MSLGACDVAGRDIIYPKSSCRQAASACAADALARRTCAPGGDKALQRTQVDTCIVIMDAPADLHSAGARPSVEGEREREGRRRPPKRAALIWALSGGRRRFGLAVGRGAERSCASPGALRAADVSLLGPPGASELRSGRHRRRSARDSSAPLECAARVSCESCAVVWGGGHFGGRRRM